MGTIAITGAASGIGLATRTRLEAAGDRVVGIDLRDAEVIADLATVEGREAMVAGVAAATGGVLDGLVAAAGISSEDGPAVVSVDYFGAVATLDGLRPLLGRGTGASAVAVGSNSASTQPGLSGAVVDRCLDGDEPGARQAASGAGLAAYGSAKLALTRWVRRRSVGPEWVGAGIRLNAVAPGFTDTPMTAGGWDFVSSLGDIYPVPQARPGRAEEVAALIAYLLSPDAAFFCGSVVVIDGGTEAAVRADDWPSPRP
jgi:NAD(P)-dependent dehydrogenase (short-subunit alcohol dehydrogenase family)